MQAFSCVCGQPLFFHNLHCLNCGRDVGYDPDVRTLWADRAHAGRTVVSPQDTRAPRVAMRECAHRITAAACNWLIPAHAPAYHLPRLPAHAHHSRRSTGRATPSGCARSSRPSAACSTRCSTWTCRSNPSAAPTIVPGSRSIFSRPFRAERRCSPVTPTDSSRSTSPRPIPTIAKSTAKACTNRIARWSVTFATSSATTTGIAWSGTANGWSRFASSSATSARATPTRSTVTIAKARRPTGRAAASARTRACIRGRTGRRRGRTFSTSARRSRRCRATASTPRAARCGSRRSRATCSTATTATRPTRAFSQWINAWVVLTATLNEVSRSMGQPDVYPFVMNGPAVTKLHFVQTVVGRAAQRPTLVLPESLVLPAV